MKRLFVVLPLLLISCVNVTAQDQLTKEPNSVYICTFNVYKLGARIVEGAWLLPDLSELPEDHRSNPGGG